MPGTPPRKHEHERRYTPFMYPFILTRRIWKDDYNGQIIFGELVSLKLPVICLIGEEKTRKRPHPGNLSRPGSNPGPLRDRRAYYRLPNSGERLRNINFQNR